jgi:ketosteroid isomerase-like protein
MTIGPHRPVQGVGETQGPSTALGMTGLRVFGAGTPEAGQRRSDERNLAGDSWNMNNLSDMRQNRLLTAALVLAALPLAPVRAQEGSDAAEVRTLEMKIADWYKNRQIQTFASLLDDDFVITFEDGSTYGKTGYLSYSASSSTSVESVEISEMKVRMHGDTAIVIGVYHEKGTDSRQAYDYHDRFTDVWMKKGGKWRLIAAHYAVPTK